MGRNALSSQKKLHRLPIHHNQRRLFSSVFSTTSSEFATPVACDAALSKTRDQQHKRAFESPSVSPKLRLEVEDAVRRRLHETYPLAFGAKQPMSGSSPRGNEWIMLLSSIRTLLDLNGFQKVVTPSGTKARLYLAEGVVATPPRWNFRPAGSVASASPPVGYEHQHEHEHASLMDATRSTSTSTSTSRRDIFAEVNQRLMAYQQITTRERLFAQPIAISRLHPDDDASSPGLGIGAAAVAPQSSFPEFVQEDITLYRMAENSAARFLDRRYSNWKDWTEKRFVLPLRNARYRTRVMLKTVHKARQNAHAVLEKSLMERIVEKIRGTTASSIGSNDVAKDRDSAVESPKVDSIAQNENENPSDTSSHNENEETNQNKAKDSTSLSSYPGDSDGVKDALHETDPSDDSFDGAIEEPLETLLVISSQPKPQPNPASPTPHRGGTPEDEVVVSATLYRRMTPSTRILALPDYYVLRHSSASTLVSVSLVVFGALPMAYRSYVFTINYDWLVDSSVIASSVVATVLYYLYTARYRARISQSSTVNNALCARVYARDDAALMILREGAVRTMSEALLREIVPGTKAPRDGFWLGDAVPASFPADPREWAVDLGFLPPPPPPPGSTK